ncbi:hypothetical protein [Cucumibacter marinus]|uniref:hypothetical protein n=1 Tax=Cucumibacter marinus TaxID=1121252 RepID=UPI000424288F|nr:hypothetical protein [Cucumibacter marinus]
MPQTPSLITQAEVRRILAGAKQVGVSMSIVIRDRVVYFVPTEDLDIPLNDGRDKLEPFKEVERL